MTKKKAFLGDGFLLDNETSFKLYHQYAAPMPIVDYHNHLSPKDIAENRIFSNLTEAWLEGDHYKWRAMRANGVAENLITGTASPEEKFHAWAGTVPATLRNPLYHWTHLELKNYFGIEELLDGKSAHDIYQHASALLRQPAFSAVSLLEKMKVKAVCTTDDPADTLEHHISFAGRTSGLKMYPSFRPDNAYATKDPVHYRQYLDRLSTTSGVTINSFDHLIEALTRRIAFFQQVGCRASDHGLEHLYFDDEAVRKAPAIFKKVHGGHALTAEERLQFSCAVLIQLGKEYHRVGWAQQFHLGALRNNNDRMYRSLGPDTGFDSIGDFPQAKHLGNFLNHLDQTDQLTRTILYNLHPAQNEIFATMAGNFNDGITPGKMQYGSAWWFLDQQDDIEKQLNVLSTMGLLSRFIGMVTDSRSFLSFPRHEYFRRILCNIFGEEVEQGKLPDDHPWLGSVIQDISLNNAVKYFKF